MWEAGSEECEGELEVGEEYKQSEQDLDAKYYKKQWEEEKE